MAYSPSKTWSDGNILTAADTMANLDGMKEYARHVEASALRVSAGWADTRHFMEGQYQATTNTASMVSGVFGGQNSGGLFSRATFVSKWNTRRAASSAQVVLVPQTCFTLELPRAATVFFQYWMQVQTKRNYTAGLASMNSRFWFTVVDSILGQGMSKKAETELQCPGMPASGAPDQVLLSGTFNANGVYVIQSQAQKIPFGVGISGSSKADMGHVLAWGISVEAFYM
jgi:hypothetical protein